MIFVLPFKVLSTIFAILYIFIFFVYQYFSGLDLNSFGNLYFIASKSLTIFGIVITGLTLSWRCIWKKIPVLNEVVFPDLNGVWHIDIHWSNGPDNGIAVGTAVIKQSLVKMSMEISTHTSYSETLMVKPKKNNESNRPSLFYIYRNTPKIITASNPGSYLGTAILNLSLNSESELSGNYFTERNTQGHFNLKKKPNKIQRD